MYIISLHPTEIIPVTVLSRMGDVAKIRTENNRPDSIVSNDGLYDTVEEATKSLFIMKLRGRGYRK